MKIDFKEKRVPTFKVSSDGKKVNDGKLEIANVIFTTIHERDCCESVYADFEQAIPYKNQIKKLKEITGLEIKNVKKAGFTIFVYNNENRVGIFIPCYNEQNGYYSSNLTLIINNNGMEEEFNLEEKQFIEK